MRIYKHDTSYYGCDILFTMFRILDKQYDLDRNGEYIWSLCCKTDDSTIIVYLNMCENDNRGSLECHRNGHFLSQIDCNGILDLNENNSDCVFNENKIIDYLSYFLK